MTVRPRIVFAVSALVIIVAVVTVATTLSPERGRPWLIASAILALLTALQSLTAEPRDLALALLFSLPPVIALVVGGSSIWLTGTLGVALLVASELHALSWDCRGTGPSKRLIQRRLPHIARLAGLGFSASILLGLFGRSSWVEGTPAVVLAAGALVVLGGLAFARSG